MCRHTSRRRLNRTLNSTGSEGDCSHLPVSAKVGFFKYWFPVVVCAALIFGGSTDLLSTSHTSRFIRPIVLWFNPNLPEETVGEIVTVIRKGGHLTEYALLTILIWRALRKPVRDDHRPWSWWTGIVAIGIAGLYASTDEWHQSFVSTRFASAMDVLIDIAGGAIGILFAWTIARLRKRR